MASDNAYKNVMQSSDECLASRDCAMDIIPFKTLEQLCPPYDCKTCREQKPSQFTEKEFLGKWGDDLIQKCREHDFSPYFCWELMEYIKSFKDPYETQSVIQQPRECVEWKEDCVIRDYGMDDDSCCFCWSDEPCAEEQPLENEYNTLCKEFCKYLNWPDGKSFGYEECRCFGRQFDEDTNEHIYEGWQGVACWQQGCSAPPALCRGYCE